MSLFFYGVCILGAVLGGLVLLVLYSLLVMAQRGDACLDQLEMEMLKNHQAAPSLSTSGKSENLRSAGYLRFVPRWHHLKADFQQMLSRPRSWLVSAGLDFP